MPKKKPYRPFSEDDVTFVVSHVHTYKTAYVLISEMIALFEIIMIVRGLLLFDFSKGTHVAYFCSYCFLFFASVTVAFSLLILDRAKDRTRLLYNIEWIYSLALFAWSFAVSFIDMSRGNSPIVFLTIAIAVSGIVLLNPYMYDAMLVASVAAMVILNGVYRFSYLSSAGNCLNLFVFVVMALIINFRIYNVTRSSFLEMKQLEKMSMTDALTGLGNEAKYVRKVHGIEEDIRNGKDLRFIIVLMDVNNLKATNDRYGHRFGCHLVVTAGHILSEVFADSDVFHVGGDEFIAVIDKASDLANFENLMSDLENRLNYAEIEYSGETLILSLAHGCGVYERGMRYSDVVQRADRSMYENKAQMKEKYNFRGR